MSGDGVVRKERELSVTFYTFRGRDQSNWRVGGEPERDMTATPVSSHRRGYRRALGGGEEKMVTNLNTRTQRIRPDRMLFLREEPRGLEVYDGLESANPSLFSALQPGSSTAFNGLCFGLSIAIHVWGRSLHRFCDWSKNHAWAMP